MKGPRGTSELMARITQRFNEYDEGIINDISFIGYIYSVCKEYLEAELDRIEDRDNHIKIWLD